MTSLINIPSEMRKRINERLYTTQLCIEHTGMPNPGPAEIRKFKDSWKNDFMIHVNSVSKSQKILKEQEIPPLLYDIRTNNWDWNGGGNSLAWDFDADQPNRIIVFYREEDYVIFKLLYKNS